MQDHSEVLVRCKSKQPQQDVRRLTAEGSTLAHSTSHVTHANWRPAEGVDNYIQGRPGAPLRTARFRLSTMEKGLSESFQRARREPSSLGCLHPWRGQLDWWCQLNPPPVNANTRQEEVNHGDVPKSNWLNSGSRNVLKDSKCLVSWNGPHVMGNSPPFMSRRKDSSGSLLTSF